jgi:hypothetical protein
VDLIVTQDIPADSSGAGINVTDVRKPDDASMYPTTGRAPSRAAGQGEYLENHSFLVAKWLPIFARWRVLSGALIASENARCKGVEHDGRHETSDSTNWRSRPGERRFERGPTLQVCEQSFRVRC